MRRRRALAVLMSAALCGGCGDDLQFVRDERLRFRWPPARSMVVPPLEVTWEFRPAPGRPTPAAFAVFVDRAPMRPGRDVTALAERDPSCRRALGCPDRQWLEDRGVLITARHRVVLRALPAQRGREFGGRRLHEVTVVGLDARGARLGESAWTLRFYGPKGVG